MACRTNDHAGIPDAGRRAVNRTGSEAEDEEPTPEMIEAGKEAFFAYDERFDPAETAVRDIYMAMLKAKRRASKSKLS